MKKYQKVFSLLIVLLMVLSLCSACGEKEPTSTSAPAVTTAAATPAATQAPAGTTAPTTTAKPTQAPLSGEIHFGVLLSLTGADASNHGRAKDAMTLGCQEINAAGGVLGKKVVLDFVDEQSTADGSLLGASKLFASDIVAFLGPNRTAFTTAILDKIQDTKIPVICWSTGSTLTKANKNPWLFFGRPSDIVTIKNAATYIAQDMKAKKVGILYDNDDYGVGCRDVMEAALKSFSVPYVAEGSNTGDKDFSGQLLKFKSENCDVMTTWNHTSETTIIARQRYELGIKIPYLGSVSITDSSVTELLDPPSLEGVYSCSELATDNPDPVISAVIKKCKDTFKYEPNVMYLATYSTLYTICYAVQKAGSTDHDAVRIALTKLDGTLKTSEGSMKCDENQVLSHLCVVVQFDNNKKLHTVKQLG